MLSKADLAQLTTMLRHNEQPVWRASESVRRCFQRIGVAVESNQGASSISRLTLHLNELFLLLLEMWRSANISLDASLSSSLRTVELFLDGLWGGHGYDPGAGSRRITHDSSRTAVFTVFCGKVKWIREASLSLSSASPSFLDGRRW